MSEVVAIITGLEEEMFVVSIKEDQERDVADAEQHDVDDEYGAKNEENEWEDGQEQLDVIDTEQHEQDGGCAEETQGENERVSKGEEQTSYVEKADAEIFVVSIEEVEEMDVADAEKHKDDEEGAKGENHWDSEEQERAVLVEKGKGEDFKTLMELMGIKD